MKRILLLVGLVFILASCAPSNVRQVPTSYQLKEGIGVGVVVVSLSQSGGAIPLVDYKLMNYPAKDRLYSLNVYVEEQGIQLDSATQGRLAVFELREGAYHIYDWEAGRYSGNIDEYFTVTANRINYLGNLHMMINASRYIFVTRNKTKRDMAVLFEAYPDFRSYAKEKKLIFSPFKSMGKGTNRK